MPTPPRDPAASEHTHDDDPDDARDAAFDAAFPDDDDTHPSPWDPWAHCPMQPVDGSAWAGEPEPPFVLSAVLFTGPDSIRAAAAFADAILAARLTTDPDAAVVRVLDDTPALLCAEHVRPSTLAQITRDVALAWPLTTVAARWLAEPAVIRHGLERSRHARRPPSTPAVAERAPTAAAHVEALLESISTPSPVRADTMQTQRQVDMAARTERLMSRIIMETETVPPRAGGAIYARSGRRGRVAVLSVPVFDLPAPSKATADDVLLHLAASRAMHRRLNARTAPGMPAGPLV